MGFRLPIKKPSGWVIYAAQAPTGTWNVRLNRGGLQQAIHLISPALLGVLTWIKNCVLLAGST